MHTTKLLIGLTLAASIANAQGTKKKLVAQNTATPAAATVVAQAETAAISAPTQQTAMSAAAAQPATAKKWKVKGGYEAYSMVSDVKQDHSRALIDAIAHVGFSYKTTEKLTLEARHYFGAPIIGDREQLTRSAYAKNATTPYKLQDATLHANYATDMSVLGSKPLTIGNRVYLPVGQDSIDAGGIGIYRTQTSLDWDVNPKVTLSAAGQLRLYTYRGKDDTDKNRAQGADSVLRMIPQLSATYNFSDDFNVYYSPYLDMKTTGHQRGNLTPDKSNMLVSEIGLNINIGPVSINPAYLSYGDKVNSTSYKDFGSDENAEYDLNIYASF